MSNQDRNLFISAFILGLGLLGAIDGIVFHQLLQWHHMIDHHNINFEIVTDGWFTTLFSVLLFWGGIKIFRNAAMDQLGRRWQTFIGGILVGGGTFNLLEGIINHHILLVHRVRPSAENPLLYDLGFLAVGVILIMVGLVIKKPSTTLVKRQ
jgi:uncharacterized membrane protein